MNSNYIICDELIYFVGSKTITDINVKNFKQLVIGQNHSFAISLFTVTLNDMGVDKSVDENVIVTIIVPVIAFVLAITIGAICYVCKSRMKSSNVSKNRV